MLLGVVAELETVAGYDRAGVGPVDAGQDAQQGGLAGAVQAEDHHPGAPVDGEVDVGEDLERAVGLRQLRRGERRLAARGRLGERDARDLVAPPLPLEAGHQPLGPLEHVLGRLRLGRLGPHLVGLVGERLRLVLGVHPLALAPLLVGLALEQVRRPADVVDVDLGAVGVEVQHLGDRRLEQPDVVADHDQPARKLRRNSRSQTIESASRWLVGSSRSSVSAPGEQDPRQLDPASLPAGEGAQRLGHQPVLDAEAKRRSGRPRPRRRSRRRRAARRRPRS